MPGTTNFPTSLDTFPNILSTTLEDATGFEHDLVHNNEAAAIAALQTKVGIDGSADTDSIDAKLAVLGTGLHYRRDDLVATGGETVLIATQDYAENALCIYRDGVLAAESGYTVVGRAVTLGSAAGAGETITVAFWSTTAVVSASVFLVALTSSGALTNSNLGGPVDGSITLSGGDGTYTIDASPVSGTRPPGNGLALVGAVYSDSSGITTTTGSYSWTDRFHSGDGQSLDVPSSIAVAPALWYTTLFAAGGVGMVFDFNDLTSVYTDTAHTTLATTVGDAINSVRCQITGAYAVRTAGSATLQYDATYNKFYCSAGSTYDISAVGTVPSALSGDTVATLIGVCELKTSEPCFPVYVGPSSPSAGNTIALTQINDGGWVLGLLQYGAGRGRIAPQQNGVGVYIGRKIAPLTSGGGTTALEIYANGTQVDTGGLQGIAANVTTMNYSMCRGVGTQKIYCSAIISRSITPTEIATVSADAL